MPSYLITGATRGIGFELTRQLLSKPLSSDALIFATHRSAAPSPELQALAAGARGRVYPVKLDVGSAVQVQAAAEEVSRILAEKGHEGLDVLVNNAGVQQLDESVGVEELPPDELARVLGTNVVGVQIVTQTFLPLLRKGREKKIFNISSGAASMTLSAARITPSTSTPTTRDNTPGYRVSKTALNSLTVQWAQALADEGFTVVALDPGWLRTDMGGAKAPLEVGVGVEGIVRLLGEGEGGVGRGDTGRYLKFTGETLPW